MTDLNTLRSQYTTLYRETLPALAKARDPAQPKWPVFLDHCFARIILDNAVGEDRPWNEVLKAPATRNMDEEQLKRAIELGQAIWSGERNLVELDERSLELRGKTKGGKRRGEASKEEVGKRAKMRKLEGEEKQEEDDIQMPTPVPSLNTKSEKPASLLPYVPDHAPIGPVDLAAIRAKIEAHASLTRFRKQTLLLLTQVPRGRYTTYQALADGITKTSPTLTDGKKSSARAIGSAMRNNPFAPEVPCHRCLASDGKLGGFGGVWDDESENAKKKRRMLREEGVRFDGKGKVVGGPFRDFT